MVDEELRTAVLPVDRTCGDSSTDPDATCSDPLSRQNDPDARCVLAAECLTDTRA